METEIGKILNRANNLLFMKTIWIKVFSDVEFKNKILDWIRQDQLFKQGIDEDGDIIGTYSEFTEMINPSKVAGTPYTLFDTGEFCCDSTQSVQPDRQQHFRRFGYRTGRRHIYSQRWCSSQSGSNTVHRLPVC